MGGYRGFAFVRDLNWKPEAAGCVIELIRETESLYKFCAHNPEYTSRKSVK